MQTDFLTIQEFIQKYEVPDVRIRRRIRKFRHFTPEKLEGVLLERYDKGVGNVLLLKEDFWVSELAVKEKEIAYAEAIKRSELIEEKRLSDPAYAEEAILVDKEKYEMLKEDRAEKKEWQNRFLEKDKELSDKENYYRGLVDKIISDAKRTKEMLRGQINYLQKQLHAPKEEKPVTSEAEVVVEPIKEKL